MFRILATLLPVSGFWLQCVSAAPSVLRFPALENGHDRLVHADRSGTHPRWSVEIPPGARDLRLPPDGQRVLRSDGTGLQIRRLAAGDMTGATPSSTP